MVWMPVRVGYFHPFVGRGDRPINGIVVPAEVNPGCLPAKAGVINIIVDFQPVYRTCLLEEGLVSVYADIVLIGLPVIVGLVHPCHRVVPAFGPILHAAN